MEKENCHGFLRRKLFGGSGKYASLTRGSLRRDLEEVDNPADADVVAVEHRGDGLPLHVAVIKKDGKISHRRGHGGIIENNVDLDSGLEEYESNDTKRSWFRRRK